jgi:hypothetical protein
MDPQKSLVTFSTTNVRKNDFHNGSPCEGKQDLKWNVMCNCDAVNSFSDCYQQLSSVWMLLIMMNIINMMWGINSIWTWWNPMLGFFFCQALIQHWTCKQLYCYITEWLKSDQKMKLSTFLKRVCFFCMMQEKRTIVKCRVYAHARARLRHKILVQCEPWYSLCNVQ